jgi:hypothetical protein
MLSRGVVANPVSQEMIKLMKEVGVHRKGLGFYAIRHTFRTVADATKDFPAIRMVMGHSSDGSIDGAYVEGIEDSRLVTVSDFVHDWLFPPPDDGNRETQEVRSNAPSLVTTSTEVTVEYDDGNVRAQKHFDSSHAAKRFYVKMDIEGKNPLAIVKDSQP